MGSGYVPYSIAGCLCYIWPVDFLTQDRIAETERAEYFRIVYRVDGWRIAGFFGRPRGPGPYPGVVFNRGANGANGALTGTEIVPLVEAGFVAAGSQYRGGPGSEGTDHVGGEDLHDVQQLFSLLGGLPYVDPERMGMMGFSRGGMMTYLCLKHETLAKEHHIRAAVTVGGVADLFQWGHDRPQIVKSVYLGHIGPHPDEDPEPYRQRSATHWPELINAPLLLLHGEADERVSVTQSRRLQALLQDRGKEVSLQTYPEGDHLLRRYQGGYPAALDWFGRHLGHAGEDHSYAGHLEAIREARARIKGALGTEA